LTNTSGHPQIVDESILEDAGNFQVLIGRAGGRLRSWRPFAHHCYVPRPRVLEPGQTLRAAFPIACGLDGWYFAEPGAYSLHAVLKTPGAISIAKPLSIRVAHSCDWDEELIAQDFFAQDVGRAIAFGATPARPAVMQTLREVVDRLPGRAVSRHAALALARGLLTGQRVLHTSPGDRRRFEMVAADETEGQKFLRHAIHDDPNAAALTLGRERVQAFCERYASYSPANDSSKPEEQPATLPTKKRKSAGA
jgi:hypothetical protein